MPDIVHVFVYVDLRLAVGVRVVKLIYEGVVANQMPPTTIVAFINFIKDLVLFLVQHIIE